MYSPFIIPSLLCTLVTCAMGVTHLDVCGAFDGLAPDSEGIQGAQGKSTFA